MNQNNQTSQLLNSLLNSAINSQREVTKKVISQKYARRAQSKQNTRKRNDLDHLMQSSVYLANLPIESSVRAEMNSYRH